MPMGGRKNMTRRKRGRRKLDWKMSKGEGTQIPFLDEQMGTSSNSCPTQDSEPRKRCEEKKPRARA